MFPDGGTPYLWLDTESAINALLHIALRRKTLLEILSPAPRYLPYVMMPLPGEDEEAPQGREYQWFVDNAMKTPGEMDVTTLQTLRALMRTHDRA